MFPADQMGSLGVSVEAHGSQPNTHKHRFMFIPVLSIWTAVGQQQTVEENKTNINTIIKSAHNNSLGHNNGQFYARADW